jgi:D-psicose/D-tagatose/L-ribulose 3-epimerase
MKLCISNIAWDADEDDAIAAVLRARGVEGIEIAPTKIWSRPDNTTDAESAACRALWQKRGMAIAAMQALLFGHPELTVFGDPPTREQTLCYLARMAALGGSLGVAVLVFGSPKNRAVGRLEPERALPIAIEFFRRAGEAAQNAGVQLAIEPNPPQYGCDFIRTVKEAVDLVSRVDHPGFRLHLDASAMILNGEDADAAIEEARPWMAHFHISDPHLGIPGSHAVAHRRIAEALRRSGWNRWVSIEMRSGQAKSDQTAIESAVQFAREVYLA